MRRSAAYAFAAQLNLGEAQLGASVKSLMFDLSLAMEIQSIQINLVISSQDREQSNLWISVDFSAFTSWWCGHIKHLH